MWYCDVMCVCDVMMSVMGNGNALHDRYANLIIFCFCVHVISVNALVRINKCSVLYVF